MPMRRLMTIEGMTRVLERFNPAQKKCGAAHPRFWLRSPKAKKRAGQAAGDVNVAIS